MKMKLLSLAGAISIATAVAIPVAEAGTVRAETSFGAGHPMATIVYPKFDEKIREFTDGKWKLRDSKGSLLKPPEMNKGLKDGVVDVGVLILPYFAADYPESGLVGELSVLGSDNRAISAAVSEYIATCDECQAEFAKNGQVYFGSDATTPYNFITTKPVRSAADLKGMRIRSAGSVYTRFITELGGEAVSMPSSQAFEAMNSGVIDGTLGSTPELKATRLADVAKYVTRVRLSVFNAAANTNMSQKFWSGLSTEERQKIVHASQYANAYAAQGWINTRTASLDLAKENNIEFIQPDAAFQAQVDDFKKNHIAGVAKTLADRGVSNPEPKIARYTALVEKWHKLVADVKSPDELAELRWKEIFSKIDLSKYGN